MYAPSSSTKAFPWRQVPDVAIFLTETELGRLSLADYVQHSTVNGALVLDGDADVGPVFEPGWATWVPLAGPGLVRR